MNRGRVPRSPDRRSGHDDRGAATVEMVLLTPLFLAVLAFLVLAGRLSTVSADVAAASRDAARAASLASTYSHAVEAANETAAGSLARQDVTCRNLTVDVGHPSTFVPGGEVEVRVACEVVLEDVALPGLPGSRTVEHTSIEVIDRWRSVGGPSR